MLKTVRSNIALIQNIAQKMLTSKGKYVVVDRKRYDYKGFLSLIGQTKNQADKSGLELKGLNMLYEKYKTQILAEV